MKALFIGRFQPLHRGHITIIQNLLDQYNEVVIMIGSADKSRTIKNPWTATERIEMLRSVFVDQAKLQIFSKDDEPEDDRWWDHVLQQTGQIDQVYSGNPWVIAICEKHSVPCTSITLLYQLSATKIRILLDQKQSIVDLVHPQTHGFIITSYERIQKKLTKD
jgi:nicotinamide-nucleotide adenylyltransferase